MLLIPTARGSVGLWLLSGLAIAQTGGQAAPTVDLPDRALTEHTAGTGSISTRLSFYNHADSGDGNPFLDEALTVIEPVILFDYDASDEFGYWGKISYDYVSSASIDRLSAFDDQSGASADNYFGAELGFDLDLSSELEWSAHGSFSTEYDYDSVGIGSGLAWKPANTNSTLTFDVSAYFDSVDIIRFDGTEEGQDDRTSLATTLRWHQILTPRMWGEVGLTVSDQSGFLETPYNAVVVEDPLLPPNPNLDNMARGLEITEELPEDRLRTAVFGRVRRRLGEGRAIELGGRIYDDDWDITSFTLEPSWYETLIDDTLILQVRYRFYSQSESKYFQDSFTTTEEFRTQDSDLGDFDAHGLGAKFTWFRSQNSTLDLGFDYNVRSDGLDYFFGSFGWSWTF